MAGSIRIDPTIPTLPGAVAGLKKAFPNLVLQITSPMDPRYNCIAWAMGTQMIWVDHNVVVGHWWPEGIPREDSCRALEQAFRRVGFVDCPGPEYEEGYDKVALYGQNGHWQHASRILSTGLEHSKFGQNHDGVHEKNCFNGTIYGEVYLYMKRRHEDLHLTEDAIKRSLGRPVIKMKPIWKKP